MKKAAFIYIVIAGIFWGTSGIFVNLLAPYGFSSFQMTAVRALVSFSAMAIYTLITDRRLFRLKLAELPFYLLLGLSLFGTAVCYYSSMQMASVSVAVVLMYTAPIYVMIFSVAFLGEKISPMKLISVVLMLIGCCLVSGIIGGMRFHIGGILIGALSGIIYALYNITAKISFRRESHPQTATLYAFLTMTVVAAFFSEPITLSQRVAVAPAETIALFIGLGICTFVIPYFLYNLAMKELPAGTASALGIIEPMSATIFSVLIFKEEIGWLSFSGIIMILVAVVLLGLSENRRNESTSQESDDREEAKA
ncbi:MAG: hypothetical protein E7617_04205 [Ruminococcaceae bacterium]|nr:hypothetical protein [Oscillospiraceae bacterium]